ncbi:TasA family protein [Natribacillus halophilus]|uniref:SipW-cognate class signal peptide n=1 Tax=Natribacillus halophilus TaxID=549003 RepID=A0A1G8KTE1_9BACI|nr:TasA family protein [Natribacillus halophilus]SDI46633.1 SipW-cognate class signal peptide [Natribacillus halophilus]
MKKRLLAAMGTMALAALLIGGGTFALFTDTAANEGNTFASGTLTIEDITNGGGSAAIELDNLAPGDHTSGQIDTYAEVQAAGEGEIGPNKLCWILPIPCDDPDPEPPSDATHEPGEITIVNDGSLDAWVQLSDIATDGVLFDGDNPIALGVDEDAVLLKSGEERTFTVHWSFPLEAGNEYQGEDGIADFHFEAVQADNNTNDEGDGPNSWNEDAS